MTESPSAMGKDVGEQASRRGIVDAFRVLF
jgi:hypothetical protein